MSLAWAETQELPVQTWGFAAWVGLSSVAFCWLGFTFLRLRAGRASPGETLGDSISPDPVLPNTGADSATFVRETSVPRWGGYLVFHLLLAISLLALSNGLNLGLPLVPLLAAFWVGAIDDRFDLPAGAKAILQLVPAGLLAIYIGWEQAYWVIPLTWAAQNWVNTWDHADGLLCGLSFLALPPVFGAAFVGVLPWNLFLRARNRFGRDVARLYMGDSGAHVSAVLMVACPSSRIFLLIPALDLTRVAWLRWRAGAPVWVGDRRHMGHRLLSKGLSPVAAAGAALLPVLPLMLVGPWRETGWELAPEASLGYAALASVAIWVAVVANSRPKGPVRPDSDSLR